MPPGAPPAPGASMPGAPPAPAKKGSAGAIIGAVVGLAVLGGGGFGAYWFLLRGDSPLPFDAKALPEETTGVRKSRIDLRGADSLGLEVKDVPPQAVWSDMSELCGGRDLFSSLLNAKDNKYAQKEIAKAIDKKSDTQKQLECGKEIAEKLKGKSFYSVSFKEKKEDHRVSFVPIALDELSNAPKNVKSAKTLDGFDKNYCFLPKGAKDDADCEEKSKGMGKLTAQTFWAIGSTDDLKSWGSNFSSDGKNGGKESETIVELAGKVKKHDSVELGNHETFPSGLGFVFHAGVSVDSSERGKKASEKLEEKVKKLEPHWAMGESLSPDGGTIELMVKADNESDAKELDELLKDYVDELKTAIEKAEDKKDDDSDDKMKKSERDYRKARRTVAYRGVKKLEQKQDGAWVTLTVKFEPEKGETEAIREYHKENKEKAASAAKAIDSLLAGEKPEKDVLKELGGSDLVDAVDSPPKDDEDGDGGTKPPPPPPPSAGEDVPGISGFSVPGGGTHSTQDVNGKQMHEYTYAGGDPLDVVARFKAGLQAAGWTVTMKTDVQGLAYDCRRGGQIAVVLVSKDPSGNVVISVLAIQ